MRLSDLQSKDVISIEDGKKIGNIIDIKIEEATGKIASLVVEPNHFFLNVFSTHQEFEIYWPEIEKIGEDVILVRMKV
jgi:YlmC/YmxH family sporulation protein